MARRGVRAALLGREQINMEFKKKAKPGSTANSSAS